MPQDEIVLSQPTIITIIRVIQFYWLSVCVGVYNGWQITIKKEQMEKKRSSTISRVGWKELCSKFGTPETTTNASEHVVLNATTIGLCFKFSNVMEYWLFLITKYQHWYKSPIAVDTKISSANTGIIIATHATSDSTAKPNCALHYWHCLSCIVLIAVTIVTPATTKTAITAISYNQQFCIIIIFRSLQQLLYILQSVHIASFTLDNFKCFTSDTSSVVFQYSHCCFSLYNNC